MDEKIKAEQALYDAVATGDEKLIARTLERTPRERLEFTGRCYAESIERGLVETSLLFARAGFHLDVMDEPALASNGDTAAPAPSLREFMQRYRAARIQRTYYLPVVQSELSAGPLRALLEEGVGLSGQDRSELLSLAVRLDRTPLARVLVEGGAELAPDIHAAAPGDLQGKCGLARNQATAPWVEMLSPRSSLETIRFVLEQMDGEPAPIRRDWFKLYFRDPEFSEKLAAIAERATPGSCEDAGATLLWLARGGQTRALRRVASWPDLDAGALEAAREAAREAGHVEAVAVLLGPGASAHAGDPAASGLAPLEL